MTDLRSPQSLTRALDWIANNLDQFDPFVDPEPNIIEGAQRISELSVALYCCSRLGNRQMAGHQEQIASFLERMVGKREFSDQLIRSSGGLVLLLYMHAALRDQQRGDPGLHELLQRLVSAGYLEQDERPPHRQMDLLLALDWAELESGLPSWDQLSGASILSSPLRVPFIGVGAAYAFTHAYFFSFGFGTRSVPAGSWFDPDQARRTLSTLLMTFCIERDWDIVGELLLCWECSGLEETVLSRRAWDQFLDQQEETGAFSGPEKRGKPADPETDTDRHYFARHYHTTLVAIMAIACRVAVEDRHPVALPEQPGSGLAGGNSMPPGVSVDLAVQRTGAWVREFADRLSESPERSRPDALCRALSIAWICEELSEDGLDLRGVIEKIARALESHPRGDEQWRLVPSGLKLLCATLVSSMDVEITPLDDFFAQAFLALAEEPATDAEADLPLAEKRNLFYQMDMLPEPPSLGFDRVVEFARTLPLSDLDGLAALAERVESCSRYGARTIDVTGEDEWIADLLEGGAMHCLRIYDLPRAGRLTRALSRLGAYGRQLAAECGRYLLLSQQPDGAFGAFGSERYDLQRTVPGFVPELDLQLPVALESIWTIGEALVPGWSLYSALSREGEGVGVEEHALASD